MRGGEGEIVDQVLADQGADTNLLLSKVLREILKSIPSLTHGNVSSPRIRRNIRRHICELYLKGIAKCALKN